VYVETEGVGTGQNLVEEIVAGFLNIRCEHLSRRWHAKKEIVSHTYSLFRLTSLFVYFTTVFRLHQMHETIVTDDCSVCLLVCLSRSLTWWCVQCVQCIHCSLCQISLASCYKSQQISSIWHTAYQDNLGKKSTHLTSLLMNFVELRFVCEDSPGPPPSATAHELFRGFSYIAPVILNDGPAPKHPVHNTHVISSVSWEYE